MWRALYALALALALPVIPLRLWWRGRKEPGYREHVGERFGRYASAPDKPVIWLHAVSLGETRAAQPLVRALAERYPDHRLVITQMTATGREAARSLYGDIAMVAFLPYDYPFAVARFFDHFRPRLGILMETEVWPNLLAAARARRIPVLLANARLSAKSARGYRRVGALGREAFASLAAVAAQSEADAERLRAAGAANVEVTGNMKFDSAPAPATLELAKALRGRYGDRRVLLLASTREGEEPLLVDALEAAPPGDALVVIVPRHPQRFDEVAALLAKRGLAFVRRSEERPVPSGVRYVLGDSMGEMAAYYASCDVAIIGGSLLPFGAQNLIEACAVGAPVVIGPSTFNFAQATELALAAGAAVQVADAAGAVAEASRLLADPAGRAAMSAAGRDFASAHRGATARTMAIIERLAKGQRTGDGGQKTEDRGRNA
ncbi:MAG: lipid IV(A) 3-deoxy-D-manno-octulosonic acid transferase [Burkholderiales bacterium]|nr:lipid IV(A) 3-deoxy-D-manno-octulosonic acid transferase [Burkholderiales bacterium]